MPIVSYDSQLWNQSKADLTNQSVQRKTVAWIFGSKIQQTYKCSLAILRILPQALYHDLHVVLLFDNIRTGEFDIEWYKCLTYGYREYKSADNFHNSKSYLHYSNFRLKKSESEFLMRSCDRANVLNDFLNNEILLDR